ncbi:hypothetical protein BGZ88_008349 [Linnemannia elongata]|nr:hypothetical protein BGZ88_008349 [Linnemannia elongata]
MALLTAPSQYSGSTRESPRLSRHKRSPGIEQASHIPTCKGSDNYNYCDDDDKETTTVNSQGKTEQRNRHCNRPIDNASPQCGSRNRYNHGVNHDTSYDYDIDGNRTYQDNWNEKSGRFLLFADRSRGHFFNNDSTTTTTSSSSPQPHSKLELHHPLFHKQRQQQQKQPSQRYTDSALLQHLFRLTNIRVASLTLLFCFTVLNLFSWPPIPVTAAASTSMAGDLNAPESDTRSDRSRPLLNPIQQSVFSTPSSPTLAHKPQKPSRPPKLPHLAKRIPRPITLYNETLIDYYHWMHYLDQDPDVETYIQAESEYTAAWIAQSGIEGLQKQLNLEVSQIKASMAAQPKRGDRPSLDASDDDLMQTSDGPSGSRSDMKKPNVEHLERTRFWDVDRWRYWLDGTVGDYGVYKRRPISANAYQKTMELARQTYMMPRPAPELSPDREPGSFSQSSPSQFRFAIPSRPDGRGKDKNKDKVKTVGGCSFEANVSASDVQIVLDVNRLAKKVKRKGGAGQFLFGAIEIQPQHTSLKHDRSVHHNPDSTAGGGTSSETFLAYTYDVSGDERYHIRIMPLPSVSSSGPTPSTCLSRRSALSLASECERQPSPAEFDFDHWCERLDQGRPIMTLEGNVLKDAGPETRWVKLGQELFLYFTRLDSKGLSREVWRVRVDSLDAAGSGFDDSQDMDQGSMDRSKAKPRQPPKLTPELVMREKDERNVLLISQTNDGRYLLIESAGQTSSHTYFLSIDRPEAGWHIVRQPEEDVLYKVEHHSRYFYLRTNHNNAPNFKVLRIPVEMYFGNNLQTLVETPVEFERLPDRPKSQTPSFFLKHIQDEVVVAHDPSEYLERFEVFVEHFVAWVWRGGLQEFRIFKAPHPSEGDGPNPNFPLTELQRVRPYDPEFKLAAVMPGNIRDEEERLFRDFYSTRLRYSNCSFIHPWALYELDMHVLTPLMTARNSEADDDKVRKATKLVCREPFPIGIRYGQPAQESLQDTGLLLKDTEKEQELEMSRYKELRIMVESTYGTKNPHGHDKIMIPISVVYYTYPDGDRFPRKAGFLNAYGAYGTLTAPFFDPARTLPLLRRGLVYIQVHPRGDGVMGPSWYTDGKQENKRNTFYDVEDALLYLRDSGMVEPGGVVVQGRSAGGLVTGWVANRWGEATQPSPGSSIGGHRKRNNGDDIDAVERGSKPKNIVREMVKVVLAQVPFLDVISTMSDPNIPWVDYEWAEWGSPLQSREIFEVMKAYSPYDRVRNQPYPAMMVMGGLSDGRVSYAEPLKFVAKLRSIDGKTNDCQSVEEKLDRGKKRMCVGEKETPLLLQMEDGGHFSDDSTLWMAFALYHLEADKGAFDSYLD